MGAARTREARLVDVCAWTAFAASAEVRVVPAALVTDGVSALLRF